jgi:hypothetical protein
MDKVYAIREYSGHYDDSWEHIMGIFTDKAKAEEFRDSYWKSVQDRCEEIIHIRQKTESKYQDLDNWDIPTEETEYWDAVDDEWHVGDIACVEVKEYPLNEIVNRYYVEEK